MSPRRACLLIGLLSLSATACERSAPLPVAAEVRLYGSHGAMAIAPEDPRGAALLAEARALLAAAQPGAGELTRRDVALALDRGALEFRFAAAQRFATAGGDSLTTWRLLLVLGMEPLPPAGETGLLLLSGSPDYAPRPFVSARSRERLLAILEGR
jgi:hypothetical protein